MAVLGSKFNAQAHDTEQREYSELPDGIYALEVIQSEVAPTQNGDGTVLKLRYSVVEPEEYKGRLLFGNINLENPNSLAQELGQKELASLCRACELSEIEDSDQLHFVKFVAKVGLGKPSKQKNPDGSPKYPASVGIRRYYFPDSGDMPDIGVTAAAATKPANDNKPASGDARQTGNGGAAATGKSRPWGKAK